MVDGRNSLSFDLNREISKWSKRKRKKPKVKLNLGSEGDPKKGWTNLNIRSGKNVDVVHDLNKFPYPFNDNHADVIYLSHVLEHLDEPIKVLNELHRILSKGGLLLINVPHYAGNANWVDITHKRAFAYGTLMTLCDEEHCGIYGLKRFKKVKARFGFWRCWYYPWNFVVEPLANLKPIYFEHVFANIFPPFEINYIIEK